MPGVYTKFRKSHYDISLFTNFRDSGYSVKWLFLFIFQSWHGICISDVIEPMFGDAWAAEIHESKENEMNRKQVMIAGLALASLLTISPVFADELAVTETAETADTATVSTDQVTRNLLKKANTVAAEKAAAAVIADTKLDLDIRLIGPTSVKIASDR